MDIGLIFTLIAAMCFGAAMTSMRKGLFHAETALGAVFISVPIGTVFFAGLVIVTAQYDTLWHMPWHIFAVLGISGVVNFIGGRLLNYTSIQQLGANRNSAIRQTAPLWAVLFGLAFLGESLTIVMSLGIMLLISGAILVSVKHEKETYSLRAKGVITGLGAALSYAISSALIKSVIEDVGSPITAAFISFSAASIVLAGLLSHKQLRQQLLQLQRRSLIPFMIAGILSATAQLLIYSALSYSPVSLVQPVMSTNIIFVIIFSFFINRNIEIFNRRVLLGIIVSAIGAALLFL